MNIGGRLAGIVLIGVVASGCAASGYDAGALRHHLTTTGVSEAAAKCVVDGMTQTFGVSDLSRRVEPTADDLKAERAVLAKCRVK